MPTAVTEAAKAIVETFEYEPYGQLVNGTLKDGPGFTGHVQDAATALTYMQQRYYDPQVGLFLSVDPVTAYSNPVGMFNRYKYAANNPYRFVDPDGRKAKDAEAVRERADFRSMSSHPGITSYSGGFEDGGRGGWLAHNGRDRSGGDYVRRSSTRPANQLPSTRDLVRNYPGFGRSPPLHPSPNPAYINQCAIRVSVSLVNSGFGLTGYPKVNLSDEGWARGAKNLADYLTNRVGSPQVVSYADFRDTSSEVNYTNFSGIFFQPDVPHIDVMDRGNTGSGIYPSTGEVFLWPTE